MHGLKISLFPVIHGNRQGSVRGAVLLVIFISDLLDITQCITQMFADDTTLYSPVANTEDRENFKLIFTIYVIAIALITGASF